ncbi:hypothetical protein MJ559_01735 [Klebsiella pneumoniae]|nr:hypothetical protein MJ559_01735 [Klebsiella pneumoniae]
MNYIYTTRSQHLTLDALKNGLYSMLENNNENIESFVMLLLPRCPRRRLSHLAYDTREPLLVKTRKGYNDRELVEFSIATYGKVTTSQHVGE